MAERAKFWPPRACDPSGPVPCCVPCDARRPRNTGNMTFITGFATWLGIGLAGAFIVRTAYRGPDTTTLMTVAFGVFGAVIGGMLGTSAHIFHDPNPLRIGGLIGAVSGAIAFTFIYNLAAKKLV